MQKLQTTLFRPFRLRTTLLVAASTLGGFGCGESEPVPAPGTGAAAPVASVTSELVLAAGASLAAGEKYACAMLSTGAVKCWGDNAQGQLGHVNAAGQSPRDPLVDQTTKLAQFVDLGTGRTAKAIAGGSSHVCAILDNNQLKCWGDNWSGQLGQGDTLNRGMDDDGVNGGGGMGDGLPYVNVGTGRTVKAVAAGSAHTCVILDTNQVKCWGLAYEGPLGYSDGLDRGSAPGTMGDFLPVVDLGTGRTAKAIATTGYRTTCAILDNNKVKCWGINQSCALGTGNGTVISYGYDGGSMGDNLPYVDIGVGRTATAIAGGGESFCVIRDNGTIKCWGENTYGAIGVNSSVGSWGCTTAQMGDGGIVSLGGNDAVSVSIGAFHTCATRSNGQVKCWGGNFNAQLGIGSGSSLLIPSAPLQLGTGFLGRAVELGGNFSCAISTGNRAKCWGLGDSGQLGNGGIGTWGFDPSEMGDNLPFAILGTRPSVQLVAGGFHTCAILATGQMKCWGNNFDGQLGAGSGSNLGDDPGEMGVNLPALALGAGRTAKWMSAGGQHTCVDLDNNTVKCWGYGGDGRLGYGNTNSSLAPPAGVINLGTGRTVHATLALPLVSGANHSCVVLDDSTVKCWGLNSSGQLGTGDTSSRSAPPSTAVNLGTGRTAKALALGSQHSCAILDDNTVKCWGENSSGQLGIGSTTDQLTPPTTAINLGTGRTAKSISAKGDSTCAWLDNNTVKCWGENSSGQLGIGSTTDLTAPQTTAISLGTSQSALGVVAGYAHACVLLATNQVKCWGENQDGRLGTWQDRAVWDDNRVGESPNEMGDYLSTTYQGAGRWVKAVAAGYSHTCFLLDTNQIRCTGSNDSGQLGVGNTVGSAPPFSSAGLVDLGTDP